MTTETIPEIKPAPKRRGRPPKKRTESGDVSISDAPKKPPAETAEAADVKIPVEIFKTERPASEIKYVFAIGRRKRAVARVFVYREGSGEITINGKPLEQFFSTAVLQDIVAAPLAHSPFKKRVRIAANTRGGGVRGQAEAVRHGIARALLIMDENLRPTFRARGFLTRDPREKERKKPGLTRARRAPQWQKR